MSLPILAFATPLFGLSLGLEPANVLPAPTAYPAAAAYVLDAPLVSQGARLNRETIPKRSEFSRKLRRRVKLTKLHRPLGIATWAAMTATVLAGFIQYYNLYGLFADQGSNPCVKGSAIFGQSQCSGAPWIHRIGGVTTGLLYSATFTVALMMPDPDDSASGDSKFARTLRAHKTLRWVHLAGMVTQLTLGLVLANGMFGLDRANDYGKLRTLATIHMGTGLATWG
ncbi:MAG: hypothetical protein MJD61_03520, partial [Proteobacteria bacterium]|nr:hypothetical protein [Pseudomonadota bacterium]